MKGVYIGCSGFSYKDWRGTFYPSGISQSDLIRYYEKFFEVLEINYTFYSMPHTYTLESFLKKTRRLRFSIKVNSVFTHVRSYTDNELRKFKEGIKPIAESQRFIALLFQFPQNFTYSPESMVYLKRLSEDFVGYDRAIELRSRSFNRAEVFEELESLGFNLVNVDAPKIKGLLVGPWKSVGNFNYVRLHGRNKDKWFKGEESYERYDYLYSEEELLELKDKIEKLRQGKDTYIFFNNHYRGKGALNALQLKGLFSEAVEIPKGLVAAFSKRLWE
ncbi:uncharacterized protein YecE (DUF72 family) [Hydrogenivirga caldilitoris]|uniref:Uncharacterized protein YecE (DUF72 family) n=1 Tax=Hydrogenivirga caldilitoris TaxID=246264 RepID=A0A497XMR8_9AQUI|nr:DUF72 domain-containing protein [Hydrogenivirga caldilitoris]RLJ70227.1 uncharacterized protein YecE (DUF72 family) [Hydrogenivirga caldilitoris]